MFLHHCTFSRMGTFILGPGNLTTALTDKHAKPSQFAFESTSVVQTRKSRSSSCGDRSLCTHERQSLFTCCLCVFFKSAGSQSLMHTTFIPLEKLVVWPLVLRNQPVLILDERFDGATWHHQVWLDT